MSSPVFRKAFIDKRPESLHSWQLSGTIKKGRLSRSSTMLSYFAWVFVPALTITAPATNTIHNMAQPAIYRPL